jgi:hypothetical protein
VRGNGLGNLLKSQEAAKPRLFWHSTPTGFLGFDRFYIGYGWLGLLKAVTFGGFLVWYALDIVSLARNTMRDGFEYASVLAKRQACPIPKHGR